MLEVGLVSHIAGKAFPLTPEDLATHLQLLNIGRIVESPDDPTRYPRSHSSTSNLFDVATSFLKMT